MFIVVAGADVRRRCRLSRMVVEDDALLLCETSHVGRRRDDDDEFIVSVCYDVLVV